MGVEKSNLDFIKIKELIRFALFRTKSCRYLYEHVDEIGNILLNNI